MTVLKPYQQPVVHYFLDWEGNAYQPAGELCVEISLCLEGIELSPAEKTELAAKEYAAFTPYEMEAEIEWLLELLDK